MNLCPNEMSYCGCEYLKIGVSIWHSVIQPIAQEALNASPPSLSTVETANNSLVGLSPVCECSYSYTVNRLLKSIRVPLYQDKVR